MFQKTENCGEGGIYIQENTVFTTVNLFREFKIRHEKQMYYCNIQERTQLTSIIDSSWQAGRFIYQHNTLLVLNTTPKMYLHRKPYVQNAESLEQTFWVLNPLLPPSVHRSDLQLLTCCWPQGTVRLWMHLSVLHIYNSSTLGSSWNLKPQQQWRATSTEVFVQGISFLWLYVLEFKAKNFRI